MPHWRPARAEEYLEIHFQDKDSLHAPRHDTHRATQPQSSALVGAPGAPRRSQRARHSGPLEPSPSTAGPYLAGHRLADSGKDSAPGTGLQPVGGIGPGRAVRRPALGRASRSPPFHSTRPIRLRVPFRTSWGLSQARTLQRSGRVRFRARCSPLPGIARWNRRFSRSSPT